MDVYKIRESNRKEVTKNLTKIGKTSFEYMDIRDHATFPTLKGLKMVRPDIYTKYLAHANGSNLVAWDYTWRIGLWGFLVKDIKAVYKSASTKSMNDPYVICNVKGWNYKIKNGKIDRTGFGDDDELVVNSPEGETFTFPHNGKVMYRYTKEEISELFKGKILSINGWINASYLGM